MRLKNTKLTSKVVPINTSCGMYLNVQSTNWSSKRLWSLTASMMLIRVSSLRSFWQDNMEKSSPNLSLIILQVQGYIVSLEGHPPWTVAVRSVVRIKVLTNIVDFENGFRDKKEFEEKNCSWMTGDSGLSYRRMR